MHRPVLYAEDDENDALLLQLAFERLAVPNPVRVVLDGAAAIEYLQGNPEQCPAPCLVLTDLKMPRLNGFELLEWMQTQPHIRSLPAVVLSSSGEDKDRQRALELGAREYCVKPASLKALVELVDKLRLAWLTPPHACAAAAQAPSWPAATH
jgi:CheY-like chemotaxis protein